MTHDMPSFFFFFTGIYYSSNIPTIRIILVYKMCYLNSSLENSATVATAAERAKSGPVELLAGSKLSFYTPLGSRGGLGNIVLP